MSGFIYNYYKLAVRFFILLSAIQLNCNASDNKLDTNEDNIIFESRKDSNHLNSEQVIIAYSKGAGFIDGALFGLEFFEGSWKMTFDTIPCTFGRKGLAEPGQKIEGDKRTPSGTFQIGSAFGYKKDLNINMNFIELSDNHYWISDTNSQMYNTLINYYPEGIYAEKMKRNDHLYKYGIIIEYNTTNIIRGRGSAIFIHIERKKGYPTAGCIAVSDTSIKKMIKWIKPEKKPLIIIGSIDDIEFNEATKFFNEY